MKNKLFVLGCLTLLHVTLKAQMKIGNNPTTINSASLLELETTNKGLVFPRVSLTGVSSSLPLPEGLLTGTVVFNTNASVTGGNGVGLYVWNGTVWVSVIATVGLPAWNLTGNTGTSYTSNFIGAIDNVGFRIRTNNIQRLLIDSLGDVAIGTGVFNPNNRERLLVDYGTTTSRTIANFKGSINDYLQINVQNTNTGNKVSSDIVATADDGTDTSFYVDMGINGSHYVQDPENWGNKHDAYFYSNSKNLLIGTQADSSDLYFLLGGGRIKENTAMEIKGPSGVVVVGKGDLSDTPVGNIIRGPNASATAPNVAGGSLTLEGGNASGTAKGGELNLYGGTSTAGLPGDVHIQGHSVKAKLGTGGSFIILNHGTPGVDEFVKLLIRETGEVNWYLDGQDLFMRDGFFDAFGTGTLYKYDFMHIDGVNGRIGFNILNGYSDGSPGGENNLPLTSSVTLQGSIATKVRILDAATNYVIQQDDHIMIIDKKTNTNSDMILSPVATSRGREYIFKRNDNGTGKIIVKPALGEKLNGVVNGSVTLGAENSTLEVVCGPDSWWITSETSVTALSLVTTTSITASDRNLIEVNFTSAGQSIDISLPAAADKEDKTYVIKRNANGAVYSGNVLRIVPASDENLDQSTFASPYIMENDFESVTVRSNGTRWVVLNNYNAENAVVAVTAAYTPYKNDKTILADASSASFTVTLPGAATVEIGKTYTVKRTNAGANTVIVDGNGSETMDGISSLRLNQRFDYLQLQSDGTNWMVISERISPSVVVNPALPYAATVYDGTISSNGNGTINLPSATTVLGGKIFTIKNSATAGNPTLTVDPNGSETVDGLATWPLTKGQFVTIQSDGTNWIVVGQ